MAESQPPQNIHILVLKMYDYVTSCGKKDFAKVIKDLEMGRFSWVCSMGGKRVREREGTRTEAEAREER